MKIENESIWADWVKEGRVKGFSIEGFFVDKMEAQTDSKMTSEIAGIIADYIENELND